MRCRFLAAVLALTALTAAGCFSFESGGMLRVATGTRSATVTILRHASRDLVTVSVSQPTDYRKGQRAATILRTAGSQLELHQFARDRWTAATHEDQYVDIGEDIRAMRGHSQCLAMRAKIGWGTVGYAWFTYAFGTGGCTWGVDPIPTSP